MDDPTRRLMRSALAGVLGLFGILFFFQTRDPMVLIFAIVAAGTLYVALGGTAFRGGSREVAVRIRCRACNALNVEDAKFCAQCGRAI